MATQTLRGWPPRQEQRFEVLPLPRRAQPHTNHLGLRLPDRPPLELAEAKSEDPAQDVLEARDG